ncbi:MAG TPA: hypothetical protein VMH35_16560 [Streptosporangiaceae bacterium]|nr:hypothetical protein [Streptosporangiaceae bacterium]
MGELTSVEICAGAGGQALGLEQAGFAHEAVAEFTDHRGRRVCLELDTYVVNMCATQRRFQVSGPAQRPSVAGS